MNTAPSAAASLIWHLLQEGGAIGALPPGCRPATRAEGYAAQACLPAAAGLETVGWKLAATSLVGQQHIGVSGPLAGRVLASFAHRDGATVSLRGNRMGVAEPEFGFVMARDLPPRATPYTQAEVLDAVGSMVPAIEIPDSRFTDFAHAGEAQLLADNACAGHFILGADPGADWRAIEFPAHPVRGLVHRGGAVAGDRTGSGAAVLGDPRAALAWLANELSGLGITLQAGQFVSTGTCMAPLAIQAGDRMSADFGPLGRVEVQCG